MSRQQTKTHYIFIQLLTWSKVMSLVSLLHLILLTWSKVMSLVSLLHLILLTWSIVMSLVSLLHLILLTWSKVMSLVSLLHLICVPLEFLHICIALVLVTNSPPSNDANRIEQQWVHVTFDGWKGWQSYKNCWDCDRMQYSCKICWDRDRMWYIQLQNLLRLWRNVVQVQNLLRLTECGTAANFVEIVTECGTAAKFAEIDWMRYRCKICWDCDRMRYSCKKPYNCDRMRYSWQKPYNCDRMQRSYTKVLRSWQNVTQLQIINVRWTSFKTMLSSLYNATVEWDDTAKKVLELVKMLQDAADNLSSRLGSSTKSDPNHSDRLQNQTQTTYQVQLDTRRSLTRGWCSLRVQPIV